MAYSPLPKKPEPVADALDLTKAKLIDLQVNFDAQPLPIAFGEITWASVDLTYSASGVGAEMTIRVPLEWDGNASDDAKRDLALRRARDLLDHACNAPGLARAASSKMPPADVTSPLEGLAQELGLSEPTTSPKGTGRSISADDHQ
jgi:hypothetical protein